MGLPARRSMDEGDSLRAPDPRISAALRFIEANLHDSSLTVGDMERQAGLSRAHFSRLFRVGTGSSPGRVLTRMRMVLAGGLLSGRRPLPVKEVAARVGFPRPDVFVRAFRAWYRMTPSEFRRSRQRVRG
jgi:AraC-like DNA-binding protein